MRLVAETIRLGKQEWSVRPLTLRQVQEIEPILIDSARDSKSSVGAAMTIVSIALRRDHPDAASSLADIEATAPEIGAAMATVLRLGGFIDTPKQGEPGLGETVAGAPETMGPLASISDPSTPA